VPEPTLFGRRLRELRDKRGWTQEELSERAKVPAAMISHFETGVRGAPSADNLVKLANALEVTIDYLLGRSEEAQVASPRVAAAFRGLAGASAETVDAALDVVETLVDRERRKRGGDESEGADGQEVRERRPR
jgi:transcriptional regulator with XRE-family HTH domain